MFKRLLPTHESIKQSRLLRWLGPRIHDPSLWHLNRRAVCRGVAVGAFFGLMIPVAQIPAAAIVALAVRANLWIAAVATLVSNPFTYGPIYYFAYRLGNSVLGEPKTAAALPPEASAATMADWLIGSWEWVTGIGRPLFVGMLLMAITGAVLGYLATRLCWRLKVMMKRRRIRANRVPRTIV